jgi:hypothetical protein
LNRVFFPDLGTAPLGHCIGSNASILFQFATKIYIFEKF